MKVLYYNKFLSKQEIVKELSSKTIKNATINRKSEDVDQEYLSYIKNPDNYTLEVRYFQSFSLPCKGSYSTSWSASKSEKIVTGYGLSTNKKSNGDYSVEFTPEVESISYSQKGTISGNFKEEAIVISQAGKFQPSDEYSTLGKRFWPPDEEDCVSTPIVGVEALTELAIDHQVLEEFKKVLHPGASTEAIKDKKYYDYQLNGRSDSFSISDYDEDGLVSIVFPLYTLSLTYRGKDISLSFSYDGVDSYQDLPIFNSVKIIEYAKECEIYQAKKHKFSSILLISLFPSLLIGVILSLLLILEVPGIYKPEKDDLGFAMVATCAIGLIGVIVSCVLFIKHCKEMRQKIAWTKSKDIDTDPSAIPSFYSCDDEERSMFNIASFVSLALIVVSLVIFVIYLI
ncbi:MAG: hypothetical protein IJ004_04100 [Clostridia bacterium]|nr:hypothetical protein [Clostridia bacterium]